MTSRNPDDLPAFRAKIVEEFAEGEHPEQAEKTEHATAGIVGRRRQRLRRSSDLRPPTSDP